MSIISPKEQNLHKTAEAPREERLDAQENNDEEVMAPEQQQAEFLRGAQEIENLGEKFGQEGMDLAKSIVESVGGDSEDIKELNGQLEPIVGEEKRIRMEAQDEHRDLAPDLIKEQWLAQARQSLTSVGLSVDLETAPYKSFGEGERFFIQKCFGKDGIPLVAKVSSPDDSSKGMVKTEIAIYDLLQATVAEAGSSGIEMNVNFPEKVHAFSHDNTEGVVTSFIEDDKKAKNGLSAEEKINLVSMVVKEMHKLPVPQAEINKSYKDRIVDVITADEYKRRWNYQVPGLVEAGEISQEECELLLQLMDDSQELIDSFGLKLDHGDVHGGNIAYSRDKETGKPRVTLMDLEALKITNPFSGVAQIANREELARRLPEYDEIISRMPNIEAQAKEAFDLLKHGGIAKKLEADVVNSAHNPKGARDVYRLMRINEALETMYYGIGKQDTPGKIKKDIYQKVFRVLLDELVGDARH